MSHRPNFLIFVPDQLRADAVGAFGNPRAHTPALDALAARGTRFTNAFVQHPVCSPSRASFLTGWYPHTAGHRTLTSLLRPHEPNLLRSLKEAGYHVTWLGKRGDTFAPGVTELSVHEYGFNEPVADDLTVVGGQGPSRQRGFPDDVWARLFYRGERPVGEVDHDEAAIQAGERWLADPPGEPWVLFVPLFAPHCPFEVEQPWFGMHDRAAVGDPVPPGELTGEPRFMQAIRDAYGLDRVTPEMWREVIATYYGMISRLDHQLGRLLAKTDESTTVTLFFADHGEYLGDYGLIEKWPTALQPCITRDPLIIAGGGLPGGNVYDGMVELLDIVPTVLELAGVEPGYRHFGRSLLPAIQDTTVQHREYAFTEAGFALEEAGWLPRPGFPYDLKGALQNERPDLVGKAIAVRDRAWTYVWRRYEQAELYHRVTDPQERENLAQRPEYRQALTRLHNAMLTWLVDTADVIPAGEDPRFPVVVLPTPA